VILHTFEFSNLLLTNSQSHKGHVSAQFYLANVQLQYTLVDSLSNKSSQDNNLSHRTENNPCMATYILHLVGRRKTSLLCILYGHDLKFSFNEIGEWGCQKSKYIQAF